MTDSLITEYDGNKYFVRVDPRIQKYGQSTGWEGVNFNEPGPHTGTRGDCVVRALALATGLSYINVARKLRIQLDDKNDVPGVFNGYTWEDVLKFFHQTYKISDIQLFGQLLRTRLHKTRITVREFAQTVSRHQDFKNRYLIIHCTDPTNSCKWQGHAVFVKNGRYYDSWDCGDWIVRDVFDATNERRPTAYDFRNIVRRRRGIKTRFHKDIVTEGKHWPEDYKKTALNMIKASPLGQASWYSDILQKKDVDTIANEFEPLSHKNSNLGYFSSIIKWLIEYSGTDRQKYQEFIERKLDKIIQTLLYLSNNSNEESNIKDQLKTKWSFKDFEEYADSIQSKIDSQQKEKSKNLSLQDKGYEIIKIDSYEELHKKFGGDRTGYKGESEWCHTNGSSTYDTWTSNGTKMFFVLAKKEWEKIDPPNPKSTNAFDDYGTSLIAILVNVSNNKLLNATLRWNHIINPSDTVPGTSVDRAFLGWADLAEVTGRDVEREISSLNAEKTSELKAKIENANEEARKILSSGLTEIKENTLNENLKSLITEIVIPDTVKIIGHFAFSGCSSLTSITIGSGVEKIGGWTFKDCSGLTSVTIPNSVTSIGNYAFEGCNGLTSITIGNSVTNIGYDAFKGCTGLTSVTIPNSVTRIEYWAFKGCSNLKSVTIPNSVTSIKPYAFSECNPNIVVTVSRNFNRNLLKKADLPKTAKFKIVD